MAYGSSSFGSESYGGSSNITPAGQITFFISSYLFKANIIKTFTLDAKLVLKNTKTFNLDAELILRQTKLFLLDAVLSQTKQITFSLSGHTSKAGIVKNFVIDARLIHRRTATFTIDAALRQTKQITFSLSGRVYIIRPWFNRAWKYRKIKNIQGSVTKAVTNYQIRFTIHKGIGTDTATDIYLNNHCNDDFSDIRFTKLDGTTSVFYFVQSFISGVSADVWIKVPSIPQAPGTTGVYIYYGNVGAITASDSDNTLMFWDDFKNGLSKWTFQHPAEWIDSGVNSLLHAGSSWSAAVHTLTTSDVAWEFKVKTQANTAQYGLMFVRANTLIGDDGNDIVVGIGDRASAEFIIWDGTQFFRTGNISNIQTNTWYTFKGEAYGSRINAYEDVGVDHAITQYLTTNTCALLSGATIKLVTATVANTEFTDVLVRQFVTSEPIFGASGIEELRPGAGSSIRSHRVGLKILTG